jgi:TusA-related sulfurtransferase
MVEILTDDPLASVDIPHMGRQDGYEVVAMERSGNLVRFALRRP